MKYLAIICVFTLSVSALFSQKNANMNYPFQIGPYISAKMGINTTTTEGIKNSLTFNGMPDIGIIGYMPLNPDTKMGVALALGYHTVSFGIEQAEEVGDMKYGNEMNFFAINPAFHIEGVLIGFNFGLPMGGTAFKDPKNAPPLLAGFEDEEIESGDMEMLVEIMLGGMIPLMSNETGRLNLLINASYGLTTVYEGVELPGNNIFPEEVKPASLSLGLNYLFSLTRN